MRNSPRHTIVVVGSGGDEHAGPALQVGGLLAKFSVNLLTGGGGGVMASVGRAYTAAQRASGV